MSISIGFGVPTLVFRLLITKQKKQKKQERKGWGYLYTKIVG